MLSSCRHSIRSPKLWLGRTQSRTFAQTSQKWFPRISRNVSGRAINEATPTSRHAGTESVRTFCERVGRPRIRRQVAFFLFGSLAAFELAAEQTQLENDHWSKEVRKFMSIWTFREPTHEEIRKSKARAQVAQFFKYLESVKEKISQWPIALQNVSLTVSAFVGSFYYDASEGRRLCWSICVLNAAVFLMWKIPRLNAFMNRVFTHDPLSGKSYTLLTSMFSHKNFLHLVANSMALASFGAAATHHLCTSPSREPDISAQWHFLAFFISAGLFSGLVSHGVSAKVLYPRFLSHLSKQAAVRASPAASALVGDAAQEAPKKVLPSLGASGAIYAAVTLTALAFPDAQVQPIFVPISVSITTGVGAMVLADIVGALRGWKLFDHYAHLGGAAFGVLYYVHGNELWIHMKELYRKIAGPHHIPSEERTE
ncbi:hypothetical protein J3R82DRAFT_8383 [Butyriboletus roseoflavus]|nr:hypothetical protein J3R82DRAFT_8383 [Butyriboletus roseoflavus]